MVTPLLRSSFPALLAASLLILPLAACSDGGTGPAGPETVTVTASSQQVREGDAITFSAQVRDAAGALMPEEQVAWSSSATQVVQVDGVTGQAQAISAGTAVVTATAGSASGSSTVEVLPPPVDAVTLHGRSRVKAGVAYQYEVVAELADGTVVERPVAWSVSDEGLASVSQDGQLVAESDGNFMLVVEIDDREWGVEITSYDWIQADSDQYRFAWVDLPAFVTASGAVVYSFDNGDAISQTWLEGDDFDVLFFPGSSNGPVKDFARAVASASVFGFGFREFRSEVRVTAFYPAGAGANLDPLFAGCPAGIVADGAAGRGFGEALAAFDDLRGLDPEHSGVERPRALEDVRAERADAEHGLPVIRDDAIGPEMPRHPEVRESRAAVRLEGAGQQSLRP